MELHQINSKIEMQDKSTVSVTSNSGTYDMKAEILTLNENVHLVSSTGYEVRLTEAVVDVHKGNVVSEKPVWVKLTNGVLTANRLDVVDGGNLIRFSEGVSMTIKPDQEINAGGQTMMRWLCLSAMLIALAAPGSAMAQGPRPAA